ncbi:protein FATTY ACID EXPORT 5-like [Carex rostrata]
MEDFYLTIPYGLLVLAGGIIGYVKRRSTASLAAGIGFGGLLLAAGFASLRAFQTHSISYLALTLETVCALVLMVLMGWRFFKSRKVMPAGLVAILSAIMSGFYIYKIATREHHVISVSSV